MKQKSVLTRDDVARILDHARAEAQANQWAVTIAIVDDGGHPLALERLDGAAPLSAYIATEKARTSAMGRRPSGDYEEMIKAGRHAFLSAPLTAMLEGGLPIVVDGQVIGAVGVFGRQVQPGRAGGQRGDREPHGRLRACAARTNVWRLSAPTDAASGRAPTDSAPGKDEDVPSSAA